MNKRCNCALGCININVYFSLNGFMEGRRFSICSMNIPIFKQARVIKKNILTKVNVTKVFFGFIRRKLILKIRAKLVYYFFEAKNSHKITLF
jgi:hypothetical protein